jgi:hypothetical protein
MHFNIKNILKNNYNYISKRNRFRIDKDLFKSCLFENKGSMIIVVHNHIMQK